MLKQAGRMAGVLALGLALVASMGAHADDVQTIVDKYIKATGGEAAYKNLKNRTMKGVFSLIDMGISAEMTSYSEPPNSLTVVDVAGMGEVRNGVSGDTVWEMHFMNGDTILDGERALAQKEQASLAPWLEWKQYYSSAKIVGDDELDGEAVTKVEFSREGGDATTFLFAKESGLIVGREGAGMDGMPMLQLVGDYKEVDGVLVPHKMEMQGAMTIEIVFEEIKHNTEIPEGTFDLPPTISALK